MVREFILQYPNMSYVNVTPGNSGVGGEARRRDPIKGHIIRCGSGGISEMIDAVPELGPIIIGGIVLPQQQQQQQQQMYQQHEYAGQATLSHSNGYESLLSSSHSIGSVRQRTSDGMQSRVKSMPAGSRNRDLNTEGGPSEFNDIPSNLHSTQITRSSSEGSASSRHVMDLSYLQQAALSSSVNSTMFNSPTFTVIRSSSTIEFSINPGDLHQNNNPNLYGHNSENNDMYLGGFQEQSQRSGKSLKSKKHREYQYITNQHNHDSQPHTHASLSATRACSPHEGPGRGASTAEEDAHVRSVINNLVKENGDLKRKLQLLVNTFTDEHKMQKVMKCLQQKRKAT